jgi:uncharacterized membrane protein
MSATELAQKRKAFQTSGKEFVDGVICLAKESTQDEDEKVLPSFAVLVFFVVLVLAFCIVSTSLAIAVANGNVSNTLSAETMNAFKVINIVALVLAIIGFIVCIVIPIVIRTKKDC